MSVQDSAIAGRAVAGSGLAFAGVLAFSFTFPATVLALEGFNPYLVGIGRAVVAGIAAVGCLVAVRAAVPPRAEWPAFALVAAGGAFGFPLLTALALDLGASVSHAAVVIGLLPAATAICAVLRAGERPSLRFWLAAAVGAVTVTLFVLSRGAGRFTTADLLLLGALVSAAVAYSEGGRLARSTPGWRVISWGLVFAAPVSVPLTVVLVLADPPQLSMSALSGFAYVSLVSMFLGFFAWYAGLARGGIARAAQVQLAQPLLTLVWSWALLGERFGPSTVLAAAAVLVCVALTQRAR